MTLGDRFGGLLQPLRDRTTRPLITAFFVSEIGDGISSVVVPLAVYGKSNSVTALAGTFAGQLALGSVCSVVGGIAADRYDRERLVLLSYLARASIGLCLIAFLLNGADALVIAFGILLGGLGAFDNPATEALLRQHMRDNIQGLAAIRRAGQNMSALIGPALGAGMLSLFDLPWVLAVDLLSFGAAMLILILTSSRRRPPARRFTVGAIPDADTDPHPGDPLKANEKQTGLGSKYRLRANPILMLTFASAFLGGLPVALTITLAIPYLAGIPGAPPGAYGWALVSYSIGAIIGLGLAGMVRWRSNLVRVLVLSHLFYGLCCALSVVGGHWVFLAGAWALWGLAFGPEQVVSETLVVASVPDERLGRVYAMWSLSSRLSTGLGYLIAGLLASKEGVRDAVFYFGTYYAVAAPIIIAITAFLVLRRRSFLPFFGSAQIKETS